MSVPKFKTSVTDAIAVYEIIRRLSTPFVDTEAYAAGIIDEKGNYLKQRKDMTRDEKKIVTRFDVMIFNIKKLLQKLPGGDSKLRNFATALFLLKEDLSYLHADQTDVVNLAEELDFTETKTFSQLQEEITTSIGAGSMDNTVTPVKKKKDLKCSTFGRCMVFEVDSDSFSRVRTEKGRGEKYAKYLSDEYVDSIREYAKKNPGKSIMISDEKTGAMSLLKLGSKEKW